VYYLKYFNYYLHKSILITTFSKVITTAIVNKKRLKNVGPIRHNEPPHAHSPDVGSGTVARPMRIDVHDNDDNDNA